MGIKFFVRQMIKMIVQSVVLPLWYDIHKGKQIDEKLVIFADAHHKETPFSMKYMRDVFENSDYTVLDIYNDYQDESYISVVKSFLRFTKYYAKAKYVFICDNFLPVSSCNRRKETQVIQLWHGGGLLKKIAYDTEGDIPKYYKGNVFKNYTLLTVSAPIVEPVLTRAMRQEEGVVKATGLSRSDYYFDNDYIDRCREEFFTVYPEAKGKKLLLWAPTFRGNPIAPYVAGREAVQQLKEDLKDEWYVIEKMHPHVDAKTPMSNCDIPTERLLPIVDILVTDYSSIMFDYSIFRRPMVLYVPDYDKYMSERGLYIELDEIPAPLVKDGDHLKDAVVAVSTSPDRDRLEEFYVKYMGACDGHSTQQILDEIGARI